MDSSGELYTIGQVSGLCNIPIQTLRYYDEIGLLTPYKVDAQNNYRFYSKNEILSLNIIKHFKASGFSLEDIRELIKGQDISGLLMKLEQKLQETHQKIQELNYLKEKLETDIENLKVSREFSDFLIRKGEDPGERGFELKTLPAFPVLFTRYRCPNNPASYIKRYSELGLIMEKYGLFRVGPLMAVFYDDYNQFDYNNADIEVCFPVVGNLKECPSIRTYGGFLGVTLLHKGLYSRMPESYGAALEWIEKKGLQFVGPATEKYILDATSTGIEENYVTEIILPVQKIQA